MALRADREEGRFRTSPRWLLALKVFVTGSLGVWIVGAVDWAAFWITVRGLNPVPIGLVLGLNVLGLVLSAEKWRQLLAIHAGQVARSLLVRWYLVAGFMNHFLPTSIGGDAYRIFKTRQTVGGALRAALTIFEERVTGLVGLLLLGYFLVLPGYSPDRTGPLNATAHLGTALLAACLMMLAAVLWYRRRRPQLPSALARFVRPFEISAVEFASHRRRTLLVAAISLAFHLNKVFSIWLILVALGEIATLAQVAVGVIAVEVIGLIPVSLGGLGLMEGSFMIVMGQFGLDPAMALAAMLLLRVSLLPLAGAGALIYLRGDRPGRGKPEGRGEREK